MLKWAFVGSAAAAAAAGSASAPKSTITATYNVQDRLQQD